MAQSGKTPILLYGSTTAGNVPSAGNLTTSTDGVELAINIADRKMYAKNGSGTVVTVGGGATGGGGDQIFYENDQTVTVNYTISSNKNAMSAGPITINSGIVVTIPAGSVWSIV